MRSIKSIEDQLNLVYTDIRQKKNPSGEGVQGSVLFINEERKSLMDQIKNFRNFILHIDSALNFLNEEDIDGAFEVDVEFLKDNNNLEETACLANMRKVNIAIEECFASLKSYTDTVTVTLSV